MVSWFRSSAISVRPPPAGREIRVLPLTSVPFGMRAVSQVSTSSARSGMPMPRTSAITKVVPAVATSRGRRRSASKGTVTACAAEGSSSGAIKTSTLPRTAPLAWSSVPSSRGSVACSPSARRTQSPSPAAGEVTETAPASAGAPTTLTESGASHTQPGPVTSRTA